MKKLIALSVLAIIVAFFAYGQRHSLPSGPPRPDIVGDADAVTTTKFDRSDDNKQVEGRARVINILADDNQGSRHQRMIVRVASGQTILIAHNVDIAPRIPALRKGDEITFSGVYEWNPKGGTVHWTHHDPDNRHHAGWIRHNGQLYQ